MCLATLGVVSGGLGALGALSSYDGSQEQAAGARLTGQAQSEAALYSAQVAKNNARVAAQQARYANEVGEAQGEAYSLKGASNFGQVKSSQAANGVDVNSGSAVKVQQSQAETDALNTSNVVANANMAAYGYRSQAYQYREQAGLDEMQSSNALAGANIAAAGDEEAGLGGLLGSASSIGYKFGSTGGLGSASFSSPNILYGGGGSGWGIGL